VGPSEAPKRRAAAAAGNSDEHDDGVESNDEGADDDEDSTIRRVDLRTRPAHGIELTERSTASSSGQQQQLTPPLAGRATPLSRRRRESGGGGGGSPSRGSRKHQRARQAAPEGRPDRPYPPTPLRTRRMASGSRERERERERERGRERGFPSSRTFPPVLHPDCPLFPSLSLPHFALFALTYRDVSPSGIQTGVLDWVPSPVRNGTCIGGPFRASPSSSLNPPSSVTSWQSLACVQLLMYTRNPQNVEILRDLQIAEERAICRAGHAKCEVARISPARNHQAFTLYSLRRAHRAFFSADISR